MKHLLFAAIIFGAIITKPCFGQSQEPEPPKRAAASVGLFKGGGGIVGGEIEFLVGGRIGVQAGAGLPSLGAGLNYHSSLKSTLLLCLFNTFNSVLATVRLWEPLVLCLFIVPEDFFKQEQVGVLLFRKVRNGVIL